MEKKQTNSRKKIIKWVAIVFVIALLLLTFFSNTIMNYSLPEVSTVQVSSGSVTQKVRCQGEVEVSKDTEITVSGKRKVKEVKVENGDTVTKGQVIMTFETEDEDSELKEARDALEAKERAYEQSLMKLGIDYTDDKLDIERAEKAVKEAQEALETARKAESELGAAKNNVTQIEDAISAKNEEINQLNVEAAAYPELEVYYQLDAKKTETEEALETATEELEAIDPAEETAIALKQAEIDVLNQQIADIQGEMDAMSGLVEISRQIAEKKGELETLTAKLEEAKGKVTELASAETVEKAEAAVEDAQQALDDKRRAFSRKLEQDAIDAKKEDMDNEATLKELEELREKVEKLEKQSDISEIKSTADGIISGITAKEGDELVADTPIANIQLTDGGYEVSTTVEKADIQKLKVGNEAEIENVWGQEVSATVKSIKADPDRPNQSYIVKFSVVGDVSVGQTLQFAVGEKSGKYDLVVPNNAVKEDSEGKFVLVVTVKGTPLGNRYKVKKVKVDVLAKDTTKTAISGEVESYDNLVTNASKPLDNGQQVRLTDNQ